MGLMRLGYCAHRRIGSPLVRGISTGERKRLNIALELLPVSSVLFLDEPTTGLDSSTGREIMANVVDIVRMRKLCCIASLHQASYAVLSQFDRLLALAGGEVCYFGKVEEAIRYFEGLRIPIAANPGQFLRREK